MSWGTGGPGESSPHTLRTHVAPPLKVSSPGPEPWGAQTHLSWCACLWVTRVRNFCLQRNDDGFEKHPEAARPCGWDRKCARINAPAGNSEFFFSSFLSFVPSSSNVCLGWTVGINQTKVMIYLVFSIYIQEGSSFKWGKDIMGLITSEHYYINVSLMNDSHVSKENEKDTKTPLIHSNLW